MAKIPPVDREIAEFQFTSKNLLKLQAALVLWFQKESRVLPWREPYKSSKLWERTSSYDRATNKNSKDELESDSNSSFDPAYNFGSLQKTQLIRDPYATWISEIMLQQTQVVTVINYFTSWMNAFPSIEVLAQATQDEVLELWTGLGYYSRARNIHKTAQILMTKYNGIFPCDRPALLSLPGIGEYTAGAILSLSMGLHEAILDGNCIRVLSRLYRIPLFPTKKSETNIYWQKAKDWAQHPEPQIVNEAIMEFGAKICKPSNPHCPECPINKYCPSFKLQKIELYPPPKIRPPTIKLDLYALVLRQNSKLYLCHNSEFSFISRNLTAPFSKNSWSDKSPDIQLLGQFPHRITRHQLNIQVEILDVKDSDFNFEILELEDFSTSNFISSSMKLGHTKLNQKIFNLIS